MPSEGRLIGPFPPGVDPDGYDRLRRRVLWTMPSGIYLLGTRSGDRAHLMTLNWATQVSTEPKHVAVSVERSAVSHELLEEGGCFAIALLRRDDRALVRKFVKPAGHDAAARTLAGFAYTTACTGAPVPAFAAAYLDCEVRHRLGLGSHTLFVGEIVDAGVGAPGATRPVQQGRAGLEGDADLVAGDADLVAGDADLVAGTDVLRMEDTRMSYGG